MRFANKPGLFDSKADSSDMIPPVYEVVEKEIKNDSGLFGLRVDHFLYKEVAALRSQFNGVLIDRSRLLAVVDVFRPPARPSSNSTHYRRRPHAGSFSAAFHGHPSSPAAEAIAPLPPRRLHPVHHRGGSLGRPPLGGAPPPPHRRGGGGGSRPAAPPPRELLCVTFLLCGQ